MWPHLSNISNSLSWCKLSLVLIEWLGRKFLSIELIDMNNSFIIDLYDCEENIMQVRKKKKNVWGPGLGLQNRDKWVKIAE